MVSVRPTDEAEVVLKKLKPQYTGAANTELQFVFVNMGRSPFSEDFNMEIAINRDIPVR